MVNSEYVLVAPMLYVVCMRFHGSVIIIKSEPSKTCLHRNKSDHIAYSVIIEAVEDVCFFPKVKQTPETTC